MARNAQPDRGDFQLFNVTYEDGSISSNRKIFTAQIDPYSATDSVRSIIEAQEREIADRSGRPRPAIRTVEKAKKSK